MPFLTAKKIHDGHKWLPEGSVIEVSAGGVILSVKGQPHPDAIFYEGVLAPGFINVHCHIELSHMAGVVPEHTGLIPFLKTIPLHRNDFTEVQKKEARYLAYREMVNNGVVAVGDIANTTDTLDVRMLGELHFCTFVETIGFAVAHAHRSFDYALKTYEAFASQQTDDKLLAQNIAPHAPYSVSSALFKLVNEHMPGALLSIHNQESREEDKFFMDKEGGVLDLLHTLGIDYGAFAPTGRSSLRSYLQWIAPGHPFIFVHNTYTTMADVRYAHKHLEETHWCLCPNANMYIENTLPDIDMLIREGVNICIGTDSLASNHGLSILSELCTIKQRYPHLGWETLIAWGTANGARALQMQDIAGTIEAGKKPGILQITGLENPADTPVVKRII